MGAGRNRIWIHKLAHRGLLCLSGWKARSLHLLWSFIELDSILSTQPICHTHKQKRYTIENQRMRGPYVLFIRLLLCARHCPQQITCIISLNPSLWGRLFFFFYSHLQMKELKFRVNTLPKVRYLVPIRTHIWEDEQVTEPIPLSMRVLN